MKRKEMNKHTCTANKKKIRDEKLESENQRRGIGTELLIEDEEK